MEKMLMSSPINWNTDLPGELLTLVKILARYAKNHGKTFEEVCSDIVDAAPIGTVWTWNYVKNNKYQEIPRSMRIKARLDWEEAAKNAWAANNSSASSTSSEEKYPDASSLAKATPEFRQE